MSVALAACSSTSSPPAGPTTNTIADAAVASDAAVGEDMTAPVGPDGSFVFDGGGPRPVPDLASPAGTPDLSATPPADLAIATADLATPPPPPPDLATKPADLAPPPPPPDLATKPADLAMPPPPADMATKPADLAVPPPPPDMAKPPADMTPPPPPPGSVTVLGAKSGIDDVIIDSSVDEAGNIWAVSDSALYVMRPKDGFFRKYTNADGLQIYSVVTAVQGGSANEGWVGLMGYEDGDPVNDPIDLKQAGKVDHVRLNSDGSISVHHMGDIHNYPYAQLYWETRSARKLLYVHDGLNAGHVFMGGNHGITNIVAANDTYGDHTHVEAYWPDMSLVMGDWFGLAIDPQSQGLWQCGVVACGLLKYYGDTAAWVDGHYQWAFTVFLPSHDLAIPQRYYEYNLAVAPLADGTVYFLSRTMGLAMWDQASGNYQTIKQIAVPGLGEPVDMIADTDGQIYIADTEHVIQFNPKANTWVGLSIPVGGIRRLEIDTHSQQHALYVSSNNGVAIVQLH